MKKLFAVALITIMGATFPSRPVHAQNGYPAGADIITDILTTNISVTLSNSSTLAASCSSSYTYNNSNSAQRARLRIFPDATYTGYVNYANFVITNTAATSGAPLGTNVLLTTTTSGELLAPAATTPFTSVRPTLWKGNVVITVTADAVPGGGTFAGTSNVLTGTIRVRDEAAFIGYH
jgi:hypothetical protein